MTTPLWTRRTFGCRLAAAAAAMGVTDRALATPEAAAPAEGITRSSAAIHQETTFTVPRSHVYRALTDETEFDKIVRLSAAAAYAARPGAPPTMIRAEIGGAFSLFGGYVTGQQIELVPDERVVQVWRSGGWDPGSYSIATFTLKGSGQGTHLLFDQRGFPDDQAGHLAEGWHVNYWEPMQKVLGR